MQAGTLKRRIAITQPAAVQDAAGQPGVGAELPVLACWASIAVISGKEIYALGPGFTSQVTHMVRIRFPSVAVAAGMIVHFGARTFLVQAVSDDHEDRRQLDLLCLEESK